MSDSLQLYELHSLPGSSVHGIIQARILELVAISSSRGSSQPRDQTWVSCIIGRFFAIWAHIKPKSQKLGTTYTMRRTLSYSIWQLNRKTEHHLFWPQLGRCVLDDSNCCHLVHICEWWPKCHEFWFGGYRQNLVSRSICKWGICK